MPELVYYDPRCDLLIVARHLRNSIYFIEYFDGARVYPIQDIGRLVCLGALE